MRALYRLGRAHPTPVFSLILAAATVLALTIGQRSPRPGASRPDNIRRIIVTSADGTTGGAPGKVTLADALIQAAADPSDNIIQFDFSLSPRAELVIRLAGPLMVEGTEGGHDCLDGRDLPEGVVLDLTACPDAGIVVGDGRKFTLSNLTLHGGGQRAILVKDKAQLALQEVVIRESGGPGLAAFGESSVSAARCRFVGNKTHGIELHGISSAQIELSSFETNGQSGLAGFDRTVFTARNCRLDRNGEWNVVLTHDSRAELTGCLLREGRFAGIDLSQSAGVVCRGSIVENSHRFGLFATGSASAELVKTRLRKNQGRGIELQDQSRLTLEESVIENSGDYGLILFGSSTVKATGSLFAGNGAHGASLRGASGGEFVDCAFTLNHYSGVGCLDAGDGGRVRVSQCRFHKNGMRPIYRGPLHIDPLTPTPLRIDGGIVECLADPNATIELYLDRVGEAGAYLRTTRAGPDGRFKVSCDEVPPGHVMTATATSNGSTSEFNVIAGSNASAVISALLGRTGPFSDDGGKPDFEAVVRRWKPGTKVIFRLQKSPSEAIERYVRFLVARIEEWTDGEVTAEVRIGAGGTAPGRAVVVPIRYVSPDSPQLKGLGGVTFMKWDANGYFQSPMEILLALGDDPEETCPRVLAHEIGHSLGLNHTRVGLLSRMQGKTPPEPGFVNDFSPMLTYYDVLALQILHHPRNEGGATLREILAHAGQPRPREATVAEARIGSGQMTYSPPPQPSTPRSGRGQRGR